MGEREDMGNHFGFDGSWGSNAGDGSTDEGDDIQLGANNHLHNDHDDNDMPLTTIVGNGADQNAALMGVNRGGPQRVGVVGVYGESGGSSVGSVGVAGVAEGWAVAGVSGAPINVFDIDRHYVARVGVFGSGDNIGVEGRNDRITQPGLGGAGVRGIGLQGIGVIGQSTGDPDNADGNGNPAPVPPSVGVYGIAHAKASTPESPSKFENSDFFGTGVCGLGSIRGGIFEVKPFPDANGAPTYANVRLIPNPVRAVETTAQPYHPAADIPRLPRAGKVGDLVTLEVAEHSVQLWLCIRSGSRDFGAVWARVNFDVMVTAE